MSLRHPKRARSGGVRMWTDLFDARWLGEPVVALSTLGLLGKTWCTKHAVQQPTSLRV